MLWLLFNKKGCGIMTEDIEFEEIEKENDEFKNVIYLLDLTDEPDKMILIF